MGFWFDNWAQNNQIDVLFGVHIFIHVDYKFTVNALLFYKEIAFQMYPP